MLVFRMYTAGFRVGARAYGLHPLHLLCTRFSYTCVQPHEARATMLMLLCMGAGAIFARMVQLCMQLPQLDHSCNIDHVEFFAGRASLHRAGRQSALRSS